MIAHVTLLAGCGWLGLRDKSGDYLLSEETVKTEIPEDMAISKSLEPLYPIPGISRSMKQTYRSNYHVLFQLQRTHLINS